MLLQGAFKFLVICFFLHLGFCALAQKHEPDLSKEPYYTNLKKALKNAEKVYMLRLCDQKLTEFPADIAKLTNLMVLYLDSNEIKTIPSFIKDLKKLRFISMTDNQITELPPELFELSDLRFIYLNNNKIEGISSKIGDLFNLQNLTLHNNKIKEVPLEIGNLRDLRLLDLSMNQLKKIPDEFSRLGKMQRLSLAYNQLRKLPPHFHEMRELKTLYLSGNEFTKLDSNLFSLTTLEVLALDSNQLSTLPNSLGRTYSLQKLYLEKNKFDSIPAAIGSLYELITLNIEDNPIKYLPPSLKDLRGLKRLYINKLDVKPMPAVLFDMNRNGTEIKGLETKDFFEVRILTSRAKNKKLTENYAEAVPIFEEVLKKDTNNVDALAMMAACCVELGEYEKAATACKKALTKDPSVETLNELQVTLSNAQNKTNKSTNADLVFEEKIKADPKNVKPLVEYAKYLYLQQKFKRSIGELEKAFKLDPNYAELNFYLAINHLSLKQDDPFVLPILRYIVMEPGSRKATTVFPFMLTRMGMKTGIESKKGSRKYYDSYVVRDEDGRVIYKTDNPKTDQMAAMLSDLVVGLLKNSEAKDDSTKAIMEIVAKAIDQNNVEKLKNKLEKMCETVSDSIPREERVTWDLLIPYYKAMTREGYTETFSYIINAARMEEDYITKWLRENAAKVKAFYDWDKKYKWQ
jgi:Leucine-rich repeat (LRR) protein